METRIEKMMRFKFLKQNNNGSTMVETLVSFTVIAIVMAALYAIVSFSSELWMNSIDASRVQQHFSVLTYTDIARVTQFPFSPCDRALWTLVSLKFFTKTSMRYSLDLLDPMLNLNRLKKSSV